MKKTKKHKESNNATNKNNKPIKKETQITGKKYKTGNIWQQRIKTRKGTKTDKEIITWTRITRKIKQTQ